MSCSQHPSAHSVALRIENLCKRFGGTQAVDAVSFDVRAGEILALLGENGAGKSTLIKLLAGVYSADRGSVTLLGESESIWRTRARDAQGMAFIHQDLGLVEWMTVAENIAFGMGFPRRWGARFGPIDWRQAHVNATRVLARVQCDIDPQRRVFSLTRTEKSLLAIGRALDTQAKVLVLDEPTASLPMSDVQQLFALLRTLKQQGVAMIYVSHRLDEILEISDRAAVMRDGRLVGIRETAHSSDSELAELIVGRSVATVIPTTTATAQVTTEPTSAPAPAVTTTPTATSPAASPASPPDTAQTVLQLDQVYCANAGPISFQADAGEILGLVGLRGAGHEHVSRALFGLTELAGGSIRVKQNTVAPRAPAQAIAHGIGLVAADRMEENLAATLSVQENLFPNPALTLTSPFARLKRHVEHHQAQTLVRQFDVNPPAPQADIQNLSGGNQQKVILARWIHLQLPILILEEPTAGVDVGARQQIYAILREQARAGTCILVVSTDFEEIAQLCDRALIFRNGQIRDTLCAPELSMTRLLMAASGSDAPKPQDRSTQSDPQTYTH